MKAWDPESWRGPLNPTPAWIILTSDPQPRIRDCKQNLQKTEQSLWDPTSGPKPSLLLDHSVIFKADTTRAVVLIEREDRGSPNTDFQTLDPKPRIQNGQPRVQTPRRQQASEDPGSEGIPTQSSNSSGETKTLSPGHPSFPQGLRSMPAASPEVRAGDLPAHMRS